MSTPINILAEAIRAVSVDYPATCAEAAHAAANALTDETIVATGAVALRDDSGTLGVPDAVRHLDATTRRHLARIVLASVGGAP